MKIKLTSQGLLNFSRYVLKDILLQIVMRKRFFLNMVDHTGKNIDSSLLPIIYLHAYKHE